MLYLIGLLVFTPNANLVLEQAYCDNTEIKFRKLSLMIENTLPSLWCFISQFFLLNCMEILHLRLAIIDAEWLITSLLNKTFSRPYRKPHCTELLKAPVNESCFAFWPLALDYLLQQLDIANPANYFNTVQFYPKKGRLCLLFTYQQLIVVKPRPVTTLPRTGLYSTKYQSAPKPKYIDVRVCSRASQGQRKAYYIYNMTYRIFIVCAD